MVMVIGMWMVVAMTMAMVMVMAMVTVTMRLAVCCTIYNFKKEVGVSVYCVQIVST